MDFQGGGMDSSGYNSNAGFNSGGTNNYNMNSGTSSTMMEASPASKPLRKNREEQTLIPVTIRMILSGNVSGSGDDWCLMDGRELDKVQIVAAVRSVERLSTHYTFALEDGTGLLEVKVWSNANDGGESLALSEIREHAAVEHTYIRAIGKVKEYDGKVTMVADSVVSTHHNPNILTHHMLSVIYAGETYKHSNRIGPTTTTNNNNTNNTRTPLFNSPAKSSLSLAGTTGTNNGLSSEIQEDLMNYFRQAHSTYTKPTFSFLLL